MQSSLPFIETVLQHFTFDLYFKEVNTTGWIKHPVLLAYLRHPTYFYPAFNPNQTFALIYSVKSEEQFDKKPNSTTLTAGINSMKNIPNRESLLQSAYKLAKLSWWEYDIATQTFTFPAETFALYGQPLVDSSVSLAAYLAYVHPDDASLVEETLLNVHHSIAAHFEHRILTASGEVLHMTVATELIQYKEGQAAQLRGIVQDVTARKEAEALARKSDQKYKLLFNQSLIPKLIFHVDTYRFVEVNEAAVKQYGYSREEFLNLTIIDLRPPEDRPSLYEAIERYKGQQGAVFSSMHRHMKKNGELFYVQIQATAIELESGIHSVVIANDMTEKLQMQQRIISEKVTAQKEIAKAIIQTQEKERQEIGKELHDNVNQLLTTIKLYIENIRDYPDHQATFIDKSVTLTQRAINEIRFLSKQLVTPVINDLNFKAAIVEMMDHYHALNLFRIQYTFDVEEAYLDKDMQLTIYRIIQEQMNNIVKHAKATAVQVTVTNREALTIVIQDNGNGFDTSSAAGGMGLSNIKNRAEVYKGAVSVESAPGKGCQLTITFPTIRSFHASASK